MRVISNIFSDLLASTFEFDWLKKLIAPNIEIALCGLVPFLKKFSFAIYFDVANSKI